MSTVLQLPLYPSFHVREKLTPSELATLDKTIGTTLLQTLALPVARLDTEATRAFVLSYANNTAQKCLQALIWGEQSRSNSDQDAIRRRVLLLAQKLATSSPTALDLLTMTDLCVVYGDKYRTKLQSMFSSQSNSLTPMLDAQAVPSFTSRLHEDEGLYALRKTSYTLCALLQSLSNNMRYPFFRSKFFMIALARAYDDRLAAIARSYGGFPFTAQGELDDWARMWLETKISLLDSFHVLVSGMLQDVSSAQGPASLGQASDSAFSVVFALLEIPSSTASSTTVSNGSGNVPFLDRSLLADYQHAYDLADTLKRALKSHSDDPRLDLLEATLKTFDEGAGGKGSTGALKFLVRSSGVPPAIDHRGDRGYVKGKAKASPEEVAMDVELESKLASVLDILPGQSPNHIRNLLVHPRYSGNPEAVISALLEGTAPSEAELAPPTEASIISLTAAPSQEPKSESGFVFTQNRRNVFDDEVLDVSKLRVGKKEVNSTLSRDREAIEQMKADVLRRVEEMDLEDAEEEEVTGVRAEDDLNFLDVGVKVGGDGEESGGDSSDDEDATPAQPTDPETILELAYIRDPSVFDRDAQTRRSQGRADLKAQTKWDDNQIEGWKIMLERDPKKKEKILQKHEFSGNHNQMLPQQRETSSGRPSGSESGPSRGGGQGAGARGRGRGRGGGPFGSDARDRAWKDKNKASRANHNRKRGHDKKMARGGAIPDS